MEFITVYRPYKIEEGFAGQSGYDVVDGGYLFHAGWPGGKLTALLPTDEAKTLEASGMTTRGAIKLKLESQGQPPQILEVRQGNS